MLQHRIVEMQENIKFEKISDREAKGLSWTPKEEMNFKPNKA